MNKFQREAKAKVEDNVVRARSRYYTPVDNAYRVSYTPSEAGKYDIYLHGGIEDVNQFTDAIEALQCAGPSDLVVIHLSTPGGSVDATDTFISAMRDCKGRVVVDATGGVHSAGTMILLEAPEFRLSENFNSLIHNGECGSYGKTSDFTKHSLFLHDFLKKTTYSSYSGFLTDEEIEALIAGQDFWMDRDEFLRRVQERDKLVAATMTEAELAEMVEGAQDNPFDF